MQEKSNKFDRLRTKLFENDVISRSMIDEIIDVLELQQEEINTLKETIISQQEEINTLKDAIIQMQVGLR